MSKEKSKKESVDEKIMRDVKQTVWKQVKAAWQRHPIIGTVFGFAAALVVVTYILGLINIEQGLWSKVLGAGGIFVMLVVFYYAFKGLETHQKLFSKLFLGLIVVPLIIYMVLLMSCFICWSMGAKNCFIARVWTPTGTMNCCDGIAQNTDNNLISDNIKPKIKTIKYSIEGSVVKKDKKGVAVKIERIGVRFGNGYLRTFNNFPFVFTDSIYVSASTADTSFSLPVMLFEEDKDNRFIEEYSGSTLTVKLNAQIPNNRIEFYREFVPKTEMRARKTGAQKVSYTAKGRVIDKQSGQPIAGIAVMLRNQKNKTATTKADGSFEIQDVVSEVGQNISIRTRSTAGYEAVEDFFFLATDGEVIAKDIYVGRLAQGQTVKVKVSINTNVQTLNGQAYMPDFVNVRVNGIEQIAELSGGSATIALPNEDKNLSVVIYKTGFSEVKTSINPRQKQDLGTVKLSLKNIPSVDRFVLYNSLDAPKSAKNEAIANTACFRYALDCADDGTGKCLTFKYDNRALYFWERVYTENQNTADAIDVCPNTADLQRQGLWGRFEAGDSPVFFYNHHLFWCTSKVVNGALAAKIEKVRIE